MLSWTRKCVLAFAGVATLAASPPRDAEACIFRRWWDRCTVGYRPTVVGTAQPVCGTCQPAVQPVCNPCPTPCPQQVCSYQPQTCYRTVCQQVPVTVYRPVTTVDPCTGCPTTTMQACTTMTTQVQRVPFTTYRQVCQMVQPAVAAMPVVAAQPMVQQQFAAPTMPATPGCSSCGGGHSHVPAAPMYPSYPQQFQPGPTTELAPQLPSTSLTPMPADQAPTLQQNQSFYQGPTFPSNNSAVQYPTTTNYPPVTTVPSTSSGLYPVPSTVPSTGTSYQPRLPATAPAIRPLPDPDRVEPAAPALLNPQDRTAARELPAAGTIAPISWETSVKAPAVKKWDNSGWRPAR